MERRLNARCEPEASVLEFPGTIHPNINFYLANFTLCFGESGLMVLFAAVLIALLGHHVGNNCIRQGPLECRQDS